MPGSQMTASYDSELKERNQSEGLNLWRRDSINQINHNNTPDLSTLISQSDGSGSLKITASQLI